MTTSGPRDRRGDAREARGDPEQRARRRRARGHRPERGRRRDARVGGERGAVLGDEAARIGARQVERGDAQLVVGEHEDVLGIVEEPVGDEPRAHLRQELADEADRPRVDVEAVVLGQQQPGLRRREQRLEAGDDRGGVAGQTPAGVDDRGVALAGLALELDPRARLVGLRGVVLEHLEHRRRVLHEARGRQAPRRGAMAERGQMAVELVRRPARRAAPRARRAGRAPAGREHGGDLGRAPRDAAQRATGRSPTSNVRVGVPCRRR